MEFRKNDILTLDIAELTVKVSGKPMASPFL